MKDFIRIQVVVSLLMVLQCGDAVAQGSKADCIICPQVVGTVAYNDQLKRLKIDGKRIPEGGIFVTKDKTLVLTPRGKIGEKTFQVGRVIWDSPEARGKAAAYVESVKGAGDPVVISGDLSAPELVAWAREVLPDDAALKSVYFSHEPGGKYAQAKQRLLKKKVRKLEILVDPELASQKLALELKAIVNAPEVVDAGLEHIEIRRTADLPGEGDVATRILVNRPPPDTLRITLAHHRDGRAQFSDESSLDVADLGAKRLSDGDFEVFAGCNLPAGGEKWVSVDGVLLLNDIRRVMEELEPVIREQEGVTGQQVLESLSTAGAGRKAIIKFLGVTPFALLALTDESEAAEGDESEREGGFDVVPVQLGPYVSPIEEVAQ